MSDRHALRRPIMRLVAGAIDGRISGDLTMGQIADDLLGQIEPLIRADERERIAQAIEAVHEIWDATDYDRGWMAGLGHAARIARQGGSDV